MALTVGTEGVLSGTAVAPGAPAGNTAGSLIYCPVFFYWPQTTTAPTAAAITPPSGFTAGTTALVYINSVAGGYVLAQGFYKYATGSETTLSFSAASVGGSAVAAGGAFAVGGLTPTSGNPTPDPTPSIYSSTAISGGTVSGTPGGNNATVLVYSHNSNGTAYTEPSGFTNLVFSSAGSGGNSLDYQQQTTASAFSAAFTLTTGTSSLFSIAFMIRQATTGPAAAPATSRIFNFTGAALQRAASW